VLCQRIRRIPSRRESSSASLGFVARPRPQLSPCWIRSAAWPPRFWLAGTSAQRRLNNSDRFAAACASPIRTSPPSLAMSRACIANLACGMSDIRASPETDHLLRRHIPVKVDDHFQPPCRRISLPFLLPDNAGADPSGKACHAELTARNR